MKLSGYSPHFAVKDHEIRFDMSFHLEQEIGVDRISNVLEDVILKIYVNQVESCSLLLRVFFAERKNRKRKVGKNGFDSVWFESI